MPELRVSSHREGHSRRVRLPAAGSRPTRTMFALLATLAALAVALLAGPVAATPAGPSPAGGPPSYAPVDRPGPPLSVPAAALAASVHCDRDPATATRDVILLVPPTVFDPPEAYGWNYEQAFAAKGWPYCTVTFPDHSDGDVQVNGEYVVHAIRAVYAASGRQVELFGWSQGASTAPRWALRWWPDVRPMVASLVGLAPDNEGGSDTVEGYCTLACVPAAWQEVRRVSGAPSHFMRALDSGQQTFPGIAYTAIYSLTDEVAGLNVGPDPVGPLPPAPNVLNVADQQICPAQPVEHLDVIAMSAPYAVAMAALATPGALPDITSIDRARVCAHPYMPSVTPAAFAAHEAQFGVLAARRLTTGLVTSEPPLACYVTASCP